MVTTDREVLEQRARALAKPAAKPTGRTIEIVTFVLSGETYGVESRYVLEVFRLAELSPLPGAEAPVLGITTWRGALLSILDLRPLLGLSANALSDLAHVIVLGRETAAFGILADGVRDLLAVPVSAVAQPPEGIAVRRDYLRGITAEALIVLAADKLLALHA